MSLAKSIYHGIIPESVRNPIGRARRGLLDRLTRLTSSTPLPPASLLLNVQMTPWVEEFSRIGRRAASSIEAAVDALLQLDRPPDVLDFGCGCGRTLLHLRSTWNIHGCDIDAPAIEWLQQAVDPTRFLVSDAEPPLPWSDASFDVVYAVSVFTHFSVVQHDTWRRELSRVLRPGGLLAVSTMGPGILANFPAHATEENRALLRDRGFFFVPSTSSFNANAAFHSPSGLARLLAPDFELLATSERGLDGFQDLSVLRRSASNVQSAP